MSRTTLFVTSALAALAAGVSAAQAAVPARPNEEPVTLGEVIVTAQGRETAVADTPIAITAYTPLQRERLGILSIQDMTNFTPGLSYNSSTDRASIRGISRLTNNFAVDNGVATYSDGVFSNSVVSGSGPPLNVERTEILRGPQGTLFGRNSIGGVINAISRRPTDHFYGEARLTVANFGAQNLAAAISGPITSWLRYRLVANGARQSEGYFTNVANGDTEGGRGSSTYFEGQLEADFGSNVDAWLQMSTFGYVLHPRSGDQLGPYETALYGIGALGPGAQMGNPGGFSNFTQLGTDTTNPANRDPRLFNANTQRDVYLRDNFRLHGQVNWRATGFTVSYVGGYEQYHYNDFSDFDGSPVLSYTYPGTATTIFPQYVAQYEEYRYWSSNEIQIKSNDDRAVQWIFGLFQYNERYRQPYHISMPLQTQLENPYYSTFCGFVSTGTCLGGAPTFNPYTRPVAAGANPARDVYQAGIGGTGDDYAAFGQIDWSITPQVTFTAGLRYNYNQKDLNEYLRLICLGNLSFGCPGVANPFLVTPNAVIASDLTGTPGATAVPGADVATTDAGGVRRRHLHDSWSDWTGTLGLQWRPNDDLLVYGRYNRGFKPGGYNTAAGAALNQFPEVDAEHVNAYEVGLKRTWGRILEVEASAFYYDYRGAQAPFTVVPDVGIAFTRFVNIERSQSTGFELEARFNPSNSLQFMLSYGFLRPVILRGGACYQDPNDPTAALPTAHPCPGTTNGGQLINGNRLPLSPPHKIAANVNYTMHFQPGNLTLSGSWIWKDSTRNSLFGNPNLTIPAYDQIDLRATWWGTPGDHYTITAYVRNASDELGYDGAGAQRLSNGGVYRNFSLTAPRTYGIEFQYRY